MKEEAKSAPMLSNNRKQTSKANIHLIAAEHLLSKADPHDTQLDHIRKSIAKNPDLTVIGEQVSVFVNLEIPLLILTFFYRSTHGLLSF